MTHFQVGRSAVHRRFTRVLGAAYESVFGDDPAPAKDGEDDVPAEDDAL